MIYTQLDVPDDDSNRKNRIRSSSVMNASVQRESTVWYLYSGLGLAVLWTYIFSFQKAPTAPQKATERSE